MSERRAGNYWPTPDQELLLRASLLPGPAAAEAWSELRPRIDLDDIDSGSQRLFPLLYRNLHRQGIDASWWPKLKGMYLHTWSRNYMLFHHAGLLLDHLARAGIPTLLLKGAALVHTYYDGDPGLRPMNDLDLAVPATKATQAAEVLRHAGWSARYTITPSFLRIKHAGAFEGGGGRDCDLHWHVFEECCRPGDDDDLWQASREIEFSGRRTRVLSPSDQLLHVCAHGAKWADEPGIRWIADAMLVLATAPIDWPRVVEQARRRRYVIRMRETLGFLHARMMAPVPESVLDALAAQPVSRLERFESRILQREHLLLGQLLLYWCHHRRAHDGGALSAALTFPDYLQHAWGFATLREVPAGALARAARRISRAFR